MKHSVWILIFVALQGSSEVAVQFIKCVSLESASEPEPIQDDDSRIAMPASWFTVHCLHAWNDVVI